MESFVGTIHLTGDDKKRKLVLEIDWLPKEIYVQFSEVIDGTNHRIEETVFRTKGIPPLFTQWWHLARDAKDNLWGLVIGTPDSEDI